MNISESLSKEKIKKTFTYSTIVIASICALISIVMIFVGPTVTMLSLLSTIFIFYLVAALSIPSIRHLDDRSTLIRSLSIIALIMNAFWAIPWVLLVWDAFGNCDEYTRDALWRLLWTAADIAVFCTVVAGRLVKTRWSSRVEKFFQSLPIVCAGFIAFDVLLIIWGPDYDGEELLFKFICAEIILVVLQVIVTQLLSQKMRHDEEHERMLQEARNARSEQAEQNRTTAQQPQAQSPTQAQSHSSDANPTNDTKTPDNQ